MMMVVGLMVWLFLKASLPLLTTHDWNTVLGRIRRLNLGENTKSVITD